MGVLLFFVIIIIDALIALAFSRIAEDKGYSNCFVFCLLLPPLGWTYVVAMPNKKLIDQNKAIFTELNTIRNLLTSDEKNSIETTNESCTQQIKAEKDPSFSEKDVETSKKTEENDKITTGNLIKAESVSQTNVSPWTCKNCGTENENSTYKCKNCGEFKYGSF